MFDLGEFGAFLLIIDGCCENRNIFGGSSEGKANVITDKVTGAIMRRAEVEDSAGSMVERNTIGSASIVGKGVNTLRALGREDE